MTGLVHGTTRAVAFDADGTIETGLVHVPHAPAPSTGFPVVVFGHMTTGASRRSAPSTGSPEHPEWRRMSQGDALCDALLTRGIAVLRPDYPGIGSAGEHPYLIGRPLGASLCAMVRARSTIDDRLGDDWIAAGHSEGAVAALFASVAPEPDSRSRLRGTAAFTPVTRMDLSIRLARALPAAVPGSGVVSALIALMLRGASTEDERLRELIATDGLSDRARARWGDLDRLCLTELSAPGSWGDIAPARIGGRSGDELFRLLYRSFRANDVAALRGFRSPVRIDAARFDEVAPAISTAALMQTYRRSGAELTGRWWPSHHSGTMRARYAPSEAADWIAAQLDVTP